MANSTPALKTQTSKQIAGLIKQTALDAMVSSNAVPSSQAKQMADKIENEVIQNVEGAVEKAIDQIVENFGKELDSANENIDAHPEDIPPLETQEELGDSAPKENIAGSEEQPPSEEQKTERPKGSAALGGEKYWQQMADSLKDEDEAEKPYEPFSEESGENTEEPEEPTPEEETEQIERPKGSASTGGDEYWQQMADALAQEEENQENENEEKPSSENEDGTADEEDAQKKAKEIKDAASEKINQKEQEKRALVKDRNDIEAKITPTKRKIRWELALITARGIVIFVAVIGILIGLVLLIFGIGMAILGFCGEYIARMSVNIGLSLQKIVEYKGEIAKFEKDIETLDQRIKNIDRMIQLIQRNAQRESKQVFQRYLLTQKNAYGRK